MTVSTAPKNSFLFAFLLFSFSVSAQPYSISGTVKDAVTHEPVPFVNIFLKGKNIGTTTDFDGLYSLKTSTLADSIAASSLGYLVQSKSMKDKADQKINFFLERASINLQEVVVRPKENPANILLKKIIKNKERNSHQTLNNYSYEKYTKTELDLYDWNPKFQHRKVMRPFQFIFDRIDSISEDEPFLPVYLSETISEYYYRQSPQSEREIIKAKKSSGLKNESVSQFLDPLYQKVNIYENWPELFLKSFVSPIADGALNYYNFYLVDSSYINGFYCYKLNFEPKNKGSFTFIGDMWVADCSFAVKEIRMQAADEVNVNWVDKISLHQEYYPLDDSMWIKEKDKIVVKFKVTDKAVGMIGRKTMTYKDFEVNIPDIEKHFAQKTDVIIDELAEKKDEDYWKEARHEKLTGNEVGIYEMVDSLKNTRAFRTWVDIVNLVFEGYYQTKYLEFGPYFSVYSTNKVERHRFRIGVRTTSDFSERIRLGAYGAYGLGGKIKFKGGADILVMIKNRPWQYISASYIYDYDLRKNNPAQFRQENLLTGLLRRKVPQKLKFVQEGSLTYFKEWPVGYSNSLSVKYAQMTPASAFNFKYLKNGDNSHPDTIKSITTAEASVSLRYAHHEKFVTRPFDRSSLGSDYPVVIVYYTLGLKNILGSEFNYHQLDLVLTDEIAINPIGNFQYALIAGKTFGTLPYLLLNVHQGNETYLYNAYAFNLMNEYEFASDMYVSLRLYHHFEGFFLNKIPGVRKLMWRTLIHAKAVFGPMSEENKQANKYNRSENNPVGFKVPYPMPYVEVGVGIENIFKFFEVEAIWRLTHRTPDAPKFGVRFGLKFDF